MTQEMVGILNREKVSLWELPKIAPEIIRAFSEFKDLSGIVARALDQLGVNGTVPSAYLPPIKPDSRVVGRALTVRSLPVREVPYRIWQRGDMTQLGEREAFFLAQEGDVVVMQDLFKFEQDGVDAEGKAYGRIVSTGVRPLFMDRLISHGAKVDPDMFQPRDLVSDY